MIYLASSWRNPYQVSMVARLQSEGYEVYDFRNPYPGNTGFRWSAIDEGWQGWTHEQYLAGLDDPIAKRGFIYNMTALIACTTCLLFLPCGRSAHLELGYAVGAGKHTLAYYPPAFHMEPELMYKMVDKICLGIDDVLACIASMEKKL